MSRLVHIVRVGARQIRLRPKRSLVTVAAFALCIVCALAAVSLADGLHARNVDRLLDVGAHLTITAHDARGRRSELLLDVGSSTGAVALGATSQREDRVRIRNIMTVLRNVERDLGDRIVAASPLMATQVLATHGTSEIVLRLKGIVPDREDALAELSQAMIHGSVARLETSRFGVLLGEAVARSLGAGVGDRIRAVTMTGEIYNLEVAGIYDLDVEESDRGALVNLRLAQTMARALPSEGNGIALQLREPSATDEIARRIERTTGRAVETWEQAHASALATFGFVRISLLCIGAVFLALGGFVVAHSLIIAISERRDDVVALHSLGASENEIDLVFATNGAVIGIAAMLIGGVAGVVVIAMLASMPADGVSALLGIEGDRLPMAWRSQSLVVAILCAQLIALIASFLTARLTRRIDPLSILRSSPMRLRE